MNLTLPVKLKNIDRNFDEYCRTVINEQLSSLDYLKSPHIFWHVPEALKKKVDSNGKLKPYFGDTVVLNLKESEIQLLHSYQNKLYENLPGFFAETLDHLQFHITIHDLSNGPDNKLIENKMEKNKEQCGKIFSKLTDYFNTFPEQKIISLKPGLIYNSCNISIVMGFIPATDRDFRIIMNIYNLFDEILYIDYWLRLHITLAYFKPYEFSVEEVHRLYNVLNIFRDFNFLIKLDMKNLAYQRFTNMNNYEDIVKL